MFYGEGDNLFEFLPALEELSLNVEEGFILPRYLHKLTKLKNLSLYNIHASQLNEIPLLTTLEKLTLIIKDPENYSEASLISLASLRILHLGHEVPNFPRSDHIFSEESLRELFDFLKQKENT